MHTFLSTNVFPFGTFASVKISFIWLFPMPLLYFISRRKIMIVRCHNGRRITSHWQGGLKQYILTSSAVSHVGHQIVWRLCFKICFKVKVFSYFLTVEQLSNAAFLLELGIGRLHYFESPWLFWTLRWSPFIRSSLLSSLVPKQL